MAARFELGQLLITPGALAEIPTEEVAAALRKHLSGDWGNACEEDVAQNEWALVNDARVISVYKTESGTDFWIITEADRSATTTLLSHEY